MGLDPAQAEYGHILRTPKPGWSEFDFASALAVGLGIPTAMESDVNAAALAEAQAANRSNSLACLTVGAGVGVGLVSDGRCVHGTSHPEMGHYFPRRPPKDDSFAGICLSHGDCLEGLASGPAILARWGASLSELPSTHPAHGFVAAYVTQACHTALTATSVETIVIGGGVLETSGLRDRITAAAADLDAGYLPGAIRHRIAAPPLNNLFGITGATILAVEFLKE